MFSECGCFVLLLVAFAPQVNGEEQCQCGYLATCSGTNCTCPTGLTLHPNNRDCKKDGCTASDCLVCALPNTCIRCVNFIQADDGRCIDRCSGNAEIRTEGPLLGNVCKPGTEEDNTTLIIGVACGVGAGLLLCILVMIVVCIYVRKTRKNVSLQNQHYQTAQMQLGNIKQFPAYDNQAFVGDANGDLKTGVIDPTVYAVQLEQLRPHTETLMQLLAQIRPKLRAMDPSDARVPTYKGVIHQLCRVLVLLHRKEVGPSIPSDALGLIEWAQQMLEDHRQQQQELQQDVPGPDVLGDLGKPRISYIDVDVETQRVVQPSRGSAVYAEPSSRVPQSHFDSGGVSPYSSVPVPMDSAEAPRTFATIHRTPSVPGTMNNINTTTNKGYARPSVNRHSTEFPKPTNKSICYFANGRYYDPNPMPSMEIYAPASSYSDRSTAPLSTFVPDRPQSLSSGDDTSEGENVDGDGSEGDVDMFPFDPKDATDPVEV